MLSDLLRLGSSPLWVAQLLTNAKSFERNPLLGSRWLNERGLHTARVVLAHRIAAWRRRQLMHLVSPDDRENYQRDGLVVRRNFLPAEDFARLLAEVKSYRGAYREMVQGDTLNRKIAPDPETLAAIPSLRKVLESREWQGLIRYIGSRDSAPGVFLESIFRHAEDGPPDPQTFLHADTFHPTVKAWLYLTDVAEDGGPFTYVPGSHRLSAARLDWERRISLDAARSPDPDTRQGSFRIAAEQLGDLGLPQPRAFAVQANSLIVADTFGFHARGPSPQPSLRVELFAYGRRTPFVPWVGLDPWSTSGLAWRIALLWKYRDGLEALGLKKNFMHRRFDSTAFDA
jgi:hypothetical protein